MVQPQFRRIFIASMCALLTMPALLHAQDAQTSLPDSNSAVMAKLLPDSPPELPDAPQAQQNAPAAAEPQTSSSAAEAIPQQSRRRAQLQKPTQPGFPPVSQQGRERPSFAPRQHPEIPSVPATCLVNASSSQPPILCCARDTDPFIRFVEGADPNFLTPKQKGYLAFRNTVDPFNFLTILWFSGLAVATDPHSAYGPGLPGFGRNVGVAYTETAVGEFFGTFAIPALTHQDPHYHRMPNASVPRRIFHAIEQVGWTQSDYGQGMPNYSNLVGTAITDTIGDLYVPGRKAGFNAGAARWAAAMSTSPISNFITEFLPDVARRVNVRIVLVQRVINQVERENGGGG